MSHDTIKEKSSHVNLIELDIFHKKIVKLFLFISNQHQIENERIHNFFNQHVAEKQKSFNCYLNSFVASQRFPDSKISILNLKDLENKNKEIQICFQYNLTIPSGTFYFPLNHNFRVF